MRRKVVFPVDENKINALRGSARQFHSEKQRPVSLSFFTGNERLKKNKTQLGCYIDTLMETEMLVCLYNYIYLYSRQMQQNHTCICFTNIEDPWIVFNLIRAYRKFRDVLRECFVIKSGTLICSFYQTAFGDKYSWVSLSRILLPSLSLRSEERLKRKYNLGNSPKNIQQFNLRHRNFP